MNSENQNFSDESNQTPQKTNINQSATSDSKKGLNTTQKILIIGIFIIIIAVGAVGFLVWQKLSQVEEDDQSQKSYILTDENAGEISNQMKQEVADGMYRVNMNTDWTFNDGNSPSIDAYVANADTNTKDVYISVTLKSDNQLVYESGIIPVGSELSSITLDTPLDAGTYDGICTYHLLDEDQNEISTLNISVQIIINN